MGSIWLTDLDDRLRKAGLNVREWSGWQSRSRSSGGYDALYGIVVHHTASKTSPDNDCSYMWNNADDRPIGAVLLERDGRVTIGAAGATNTAGKGGPWTTSKGTVPLDKGNAYTFNIEAANNGTGEAWPQAQQDAYIVLCRTICDWRGFDPNRDIYAHFEWAPGRKYDPAGPSAWGGSGQDLWEMDDFRADVRSGTTTPPPTTPPPTTPPPTTPPQTGDKDMAAIMPTIKKGQSGPYVERMQHLLAAAGFMDPGNTSNYDGVWGNGTDGAKKKFDDAHGLTSSNTDCGAKSWESLLTGKKW
jgi:hypothetical protein